MGVAGDLLFEITVGLHKQSWALLVSSFDGGTLHTMLSICDEKANK